MNNFFASLGLFLAITSAAWAGDDAKTVALVDTPAAVQKTIATQIGDGKTGDIDRTTENGETVFEVDYSTKAGDDGDFTVADDGTLLSVGVALTDTPAAVQKTVQAQLAGWDITGINKNLAETEVSFDVEASKDGRERSFNVDNNGVLSSVDMTLTETPAAVQTAIKTEIADGAVQSITENIDPDGNSYDVEAVTKAGARKTFSVAPDGRLLSVGVSLEQVPPGARRTITAKIGDGKILEIDKSLVEKEDNVLPYEVQGRKAGREFDFSVGPRGRFLGMDE
jgi:uncharacterized membrane protein YkoI